MDITFHAAIAKPLAVEAARDSILALDLPDVRVYLEAPLAQALGMPQRLAPEGLVSALQVAFGGDGTILAAAAKAAEAGTPVLGVNIGRMGFLSEVEPHQVNEAMLRWVRGEYLLEKRMMLQAVFPSVDERVYYALNDVALLKHDPNNVVYIDAAVGGETALSCACDGMLVSTPTGSTAYALSAGGPLMMPDMRARLLLPVCAHELGVRPLVMGQSDDVHMCVMQTSQSAGAFCDGRRVGELEPGQGCRVSTAPFDALFVRFSRPEFVSRIKRKLY